MCYEAAYRILRDEDEDQEVYAGLAHHASRWLKRMTGAYSDFVIEDTTAVSLNGDISKGIDDTGLGYYNPYSINNKSK